MNQLAINLQILFVSDNIVTKNGDTQSSERYYIDVIYEQALKLGATISKNKSSQKHVDFKNVKWPCGTVCSYEVKKVNCGDRFILNDTMIPNCNDLYYIFIFAKIKQVQIIKSSDLIKNNIIPYSPKITIKMCFYNLSHHVCDMSLENDFTNESVLKLFSLTMKFIAEAVSRRIISLFDFGEMVKVNYKFGNFTSRPRPNWALKVPHL